MKSGVDSSTKFINKEYHHRIQSSNERDANSKDEVTFTEIKETKCID